MRRSSSSIARKALPLTSVALLIATLLAMSAWRITPWFPTDDAYISFRYATNWADGKGLVFNPGERVEGYSNFLYVACLAVGSRLGVTPPLLARWLNLASMAAIVGLLVFALPVPIRRSRIRFLAALPIVISAHTVANVLSGLEAPMMAALLLAAVLALENRCRWLTPVLYLLVSLLRPEGVALAFVGAVIDTCRAKSADGKRRLVAAVSRWGLGFGLPFLAYLVGRWIYYGYPLPNSVYAKMGWPLADAIRISLRGMAPALDYYWPFLAIAIVGWLAHGLRSPVPELWGVTLSFAAVLAISIYTGAGDPYRAFLRYPFPALPLLGVMAVAAFERVVSGLSVRGFRLAAAATLVVALGAQAYLAPKPLSPYQPPETGWARVRMGWNMWSRQDTAPHPSDVRGLPMALHAVADWLRQQADEDQTVATGEVGIVPYYSGLRVLDSAGLVDEHIAHLPGRHSEKTDVDYVFREDPDYFVFKKRTDCLCSGTPADVRIYRDPRFAERYRFAAMFSEGQRSILIFERRDRVSAPSLNLCHQHRQAEVVRRDSHGRWIEAGEGLAGSIGVGTVSVVTERRRTELLAAIHDAESLPSGSPLMEAWVGQWQCWIQHLPLAGGSSEIRHRIVVYPGSSFRFTIGIPADRRHESVNGEVLFEVELVSRADQERSDVFARALVVDPMGVFEPHEVDLSRFAGREADLVLRVSGGAADNSVGRVVSAGWAGPKVLVSTEAYGASR